MGTATILGGTYNTLIMPDGREWMSQDLAAIGYGMTSRATPYGRAYVPDSTFLAVMAGLPDGWHLPTESEWYAMGFAVDPALGSLGELTEAGGHLKAISSDWASPNTGASDTYGFAAYPNRDDVSGYPYHANWHGWWWTNTEDGTYTWRNVTLAYDNSRMAFAGNGKTDYAGVRLVRDAESFTGARAVVSGEFRNASEVHVSKDGVWRKANRIFVPVSGAWREVQ